MKKKRNFHPGVINAKRKRRRKRKGSFFPVSPLGEKERKENMAAVKRSEREREIYCTFLGERWGNSMHS